MISSATVKCDEKENFPEETEFDVETIKNLKKCFQEESMKRTVDKIDTKSNANFDNRNMTSFRAPEENHGSWSRRLEFNPNVDEYFLNHLTPGQDCMNPDEAFSKSPKKIKFSSLKKESNKKHVCNYKGCAQKFDRVGQG